MNIKTVNRIAKIMRFPFKVINKVCMFISSPIAIPMLFIMADWEDDWDRRYYTGIMKRIVSFGYWKNKKEDSS